MNALKCLQLTDTHALGSGGQCHQCDKPIYHAGDISVMCHHTGPTCWPEKNILLGSGIKFRTSISQFFGQHGFFYQLINYFIYGFLNSSLASLLNPGMKRWAIYD